MGNRTLRGVFSRLALVAGLGLGAVEMNDAHREHRDIDATPMKAAGGILALGAVLALTTRIKKNEPPERGPHPHW